MKSFREFSVALKRSANILESVSNKIQNFTNPSMKDYFNLILKECNNKKSLFEETVTSDIAGFTPPLTMVKRRPPDDIVFKEDEEEKILEEYNLNKETMQKVYGEQYKSALIALKEISLNN